MSTFDFHLSEICDRKGRVARTLTRAPGDHAPTLGPYVTVEEARPEWMEQPDDPFNEDRAVQLRVAHAARENGKEVRRAWAAIRTVREHPLAGTPGVDAEEGYYHAVLAVYARWFAEHESLFPTLPPLPMDLNESVSALDDRLVIKAKDVCRLLSVSPDRLNMLVSEGRLVPVRYVDGGDRYFTRGSVERFVDDLEDRGFRR